uniref:Toxin of the YafQ-DinJ toxin-antitoxin system n=1 Tax=mine drainage metagenome TaxID=410659 RepID=E6QM33_9ZZZZ
MRTINQTTTFKRDLKRESKGKHRAYLSENFVAAVQTLANDQPLTDKFHDHALSNNWEGYRDCHIKPGLVLIYRKPDDETLQLVRLGSHSELGL